MAVRLANIREVETEAYGVWGGNTKSELIKEPYSDFHDPHPHHDV